MLKDLEIEKLELKNQLEDLIDSMILLKELYNIGEKGDLLDLGDDPSSFQWTPSSVNSV